MKSRRLGNTQMMLTILITVVVTCCATILILNVRAGEKQIRYHVAHRFAVEDPQFLRSMGQLLGPAILSGNEVQALHNGDQIFPAMLDAIRAAQKSMSVGSTNFDDRSFRLNAEANLNIFDATFAAEQMKVFEEDKRHSRLMGRAEFRKRSRVGKIVEGIAGTFRRQL